MVNYPSCEPLMNRASYSVIVTTPSSDMVAVCADRATAVGVAITAHSYLRLPIGWTRYFMHATVFAIVAVAFSSMSVTPRADRPVAIQALRPIVRAFAKNPVEVLLPESLHELPIEHLTAQPPKIAASGYRIDLDRAPGCFQCESEACAHGSISAGTLDIAL